MLMLLAQTVDYMTSMLKLSVYGYIWVSVDEDSFEAVIQNKNNMVKLILILSQIELIKQYTLLRTLF